MKPEQNIDLNSTLDKIKVCYIIDMILSVLALYVLDQISQIPVREGVSLP